ncbi:UrcA family protein [Sphingomonas sp. BK069]|uniref:UrcA family protein n=1 Tax=Sphingomonas sp. BK069 TaxID=2586979 RepID=UPI001615B909|nr:UrcA family protein [Sphingomonas sp. BK069]MBB3348350.1 UrcA family protein [Sphingomonas sp. BK069]
MKFVILVAALAANGLVAPVLAQDAPAAIAVSYQDLDLARAGDVSKLDLRIARAADTACGRVSSIDLAGIVDKPRCRHDAIVSARLLRDRAVAAAGVGGASGNRTH